MHFFNIKYAHYNDEEINAANKKIIQSSNGIDYYATKLKKELIT